MGGLVASLALLVDLRTAIGFSSFGVLVYYAITNLSALRLGLAIAAALPPSSTLPGLAVLLLGVLIRIAVKAIMHR